MNRPSVGDQDEAGRWAAIALSSCVVAGCVLLADLVVAVPEVLLVTAGVVVVIGAVVIGRIGYLRARRTGAGYVVSLGRSVRAAVRCWSSSWSDRDSDTRMTAWPPH